MTALLRFARSNAVGLVALLVALSGTAYAATALPRNSVGPVQLRPNAVTTGDIAGNGVGLTDLRTGAVTSRSVRNGGIGRADLAPSARSFVDGGVRSNGGETPAAVAASQKVNVRDVVLPRAGSVLVTYANPSIGFNCSSGGIAKLALYWDDQPIAGTGVTLADWDSARVTMSAGTVSSTAGTHEASMRWYCSGGTIGSTTINNGNVWTFAMS